jgi:hypothetical protein
LVTIIHTNTGFRKPCARYVPKQLNTEWKGYQKACLDLKERNKEVFLKEKKTLRNFMVCYIVYTNVNSIFQAHVLLDLLEQAAKLSSNSESYFSAPSQESENDVLFPEECLGIQVAIRLEILWLLF